MRSAFRALLAVASALGVARPVAAQMSDTAVSHADSVPHSRRIEGRVMRGSRAGRTPVPNLWVVLHRVGPDRAGPLDSTKTRGDGGFHFGYKTSGSPDAVYFVSASYGGVAYFTAPMHADVVTGDDATIVVFDTAAAPGVVKVAGRHFIVGAAQPNGRRPIGEVYDLENDSTITVVAHDSTPLFVAHLPPGALNFQLNENGDIAPGAVTKHGDEVGLFAPISPGVRQLAFTYELAADAFPLSVPLERPVSVLEVLVQETAARVGAPGLRELAPVSTEGRTFRRFLAQDVAGNGVIRIDAPELATGARTRTIAIVASVIGALMLLAGLVAVRRRAPASVSGVRTVPSVPAMPLAAAPRVEAESERLVREIAELDAEHENAARNGGAAADDYEARRAALKQQLATVLAAERRRA